MPAIHEDPSTGAFLDFLDADLHSERNLAALPEDLAQYMLANAGLEVDLNNDIDGEIAL